AIQSGRSEAPAPGSLHRGRLGVRVVDEELPVQLDEVLPLLRRLILDENRLHRADRLAGAAVDALIGMDEELVGALVDAVDRADLNAGLVLHVDAGLRDTVRHSELVLRSRSRRRFAVAVLKPARAGGTPGALHARGGAAGPVAFPEGGESRLDRVLSEDRAMGLDRRQLQFGHDVSVLDLARL